MLAKFEEVLPGLADRIFSEVERQTAHRIKIEEKVIDGDIRRADRGLIAGFILCLSLIGCGTCCILEGHDWSGATIITGAIGTLAGIFIYGTISRKRERLAKAKIMTDTK
jgi:uncharacterized membrane protein